MIHVSIIDGSDKPPFALAADEVKRPPSNFQMNRQIESREYIPTGTPSKLQYL